MTLSSNTDQPCPYAPEKRKQYARHVKKQARNIVRAERRKAKMAARKARFAPEQEIVTGNHRYAVSRAIATI